MSEEVLVKRHLAKTITWRIVGTIDTIIIAWVITGNPLVGLSIGGTEVITKMALYYFHERVWLKLGYSGNAKTILYRYRHFAKTITWRVIGTLDTTLIAWIISGDPMIGLKVGGIEIVTKMVLYYLHERIWHRSHFGVNNKETQAENFTTIR
ncbi:MAG: DUF2061 domain-containing protein [Bacteroidetes bacterium]|nr:DUF2061 domain-containing protein [Bacteroidota bacterium]MDA1121364.1 DUF2061 domain-containing protein [Bacteroidota bacterium]